MNDDEIIMISDKYMDYISDRPQTNFERITKSIESLAGMIVAAYMDLLSIPKSKGIDFSNYESVLKWSQEEVEE